MPRANEHYDDHTGSQEQEKCDAEVSVVSATAWPDVRARWTEGFFVGRPHNAAAVQTVAINRMSGDPGGSEQKPGHEEHGNRSGVAPNRRAHSCISRHAHMMPHEDPIRECIAAVLRWGRLDPEEARDRLSRWTTVERTD